jgi:hypothetical protein
MLYAVSLLLGMINTYAGIAFLVLLQLNSAADTPTRLVLTTELAESAGRLHSESTQHCNLAALFLT